MNGREYWKFLDEWNPNLLYQYARNHNRTNETCQLTGSTSETYYLIWFVFRYVLDCKTYEEALKYADESTFSKYGISDSLFYRSYEMAEEKTERLIAIGSEEFGKVIIKISEKSFYQSSNKSRIQNTIEFLLDIIYHRYNYLEQIECYIRHFSKPGVFPAKQPVAVITAKKILKTGVAALREKPAYREVLALHESTRKDILGEFYYEI